MKGFGNAVDRVVALNNNAYNVIRFDGQTTANPVMVAVDHLNGGGAVAEALHKRAVVRHGGFVSLLDRCGRSENAKLLLREDQG